MQWRIGTVVSDSGKRDAEVYRGVARVWGEAPAKAPWGFLEGLAAGGSAVCLVALRIRADRASHSLKSPRPAGFSLFACFLSSFLAVRQLLQMLPGLFLRNDLLPVPWIVPRTVELM
ncbi:hypothetical protein ACFSKY_18310 [Azotobacter chroococcum]|jgi:hypothetical protein|uniref:hypothetical protein n=1 Tax=Azotobacter chroococcum TaxID=353 RepID=UPI001040906C|nr:hypothetical protein [Azotobacter chroococcum]TBV94624.1 hypothetical protein E0E53_14270 [Azotobacter chroococcum]